MFSGRFRSSALSIRVGLNASYCCSNLLFNRHETYKLLPNVIITFLSYNISSILINKLIPNATSRDPLLHLEGAQL